MLLLPITFEHFAWFQQRETKYEIIALSSLQPKKIERKTQRKNIIEIKENNSREL